jgi:hypothetical protein
MVVEKVALYVRKGGLLVSGVAEVQATCFLTDLACPRRLPAAKTAGPAA